MDEANVVLDVAFTPDEREQVRRALQGLPIALRSPGRPVVVRRTPAPPLPEDLGAAHLLSEISRSGARASLAIGGLSMRASEWLQRHPDSDLTAEILTERLLARTLAHTLAHRFDRERGLSREEGWERLSEWRSPARSGERNPLMFASIEGGESPIEDLSATIALLWANAPLPGDLPLHPACRIPSKVAFIERALGAAPGDPGCAPLAGTPLDPERVEAVEIVFVAASVRHPASIAGHMTVVVESAARIGVERESYVLTAVTGERYGLEYLVRGLLGGWPSAISSMSYRRFALDYSEREDRDLHRYRLVLSPEQERAVLSRLYELRFGWRRPYVFTSRNCTHLPLELARSALDLGEDLRMPSPFSADALLSRLYRDGLLQELDPDGPEEHSLSARAARARALRREIARQITEPALATIVAQASARSEQSRLSAYRTLAASLPSASPEQLSLLDGYLSLSDPIERHAQREARSEGAEERAGALIDALWAAKASVRLAERALSSPAPPKIDGNALLMASLPRAVREGSAHTPLGQAALRLGARLDRGELLPLLSAERSLYRSEVGEARRFMLAPGLAIALLSAELSVGLSAQPQLGVRGVVASLRQIRGERASGNVGFYGRLGALDLAWFERRTIALDLLEVGIAAEILQGHAHRQSLQWMLGLSGLSRWSSERLVAGVGLPIELRLHLGHRTSALTALDLGARLVPVAPGPWGEGSAWGRARVQLGSPFGADLALEGRYLLGTSGAPRAGRLGVVQEVGLGVVVEPN